MPLKGMWSGSRSCTGAGVRFMGLTHLSNNDLGGSSFPMMGNRGLTPLGHQVVEEMARVGLSVDVAHASERTLEELFSYSSVRFFCSHTGVRGAGGGWRNLSDESLRRIADRGGVVGIILAPIYLGGDTVEDVVRHIEHAVGVMGEEGVGIGSDYDGMVALPRGFRDVTDLPRLTEALLRRHPEAVGGAHPRGQLPALLPGDARRLTGLVRPGIVGGSMNRFLAILSLVGFLVLSGCGGPKAGESCNVTGYVCGSETEALECRQSQWRALPCRGALGCTESASHRPLRHLRQRRGRQLCAQCRGPGPVPRGRLGRPRVPDGRARGDGDVPLLRSSGAQIVCQK